MFCRCHVIDSFCFMLILTTHCKGKPGFGNYELLLNKMSEERSFSGRLQVKCVNTALSCDSLCRSLHYRQICLDRDLKLYFRVIYYFTLLGVTAGSWWKCCTACFCYHSACLPCLSLCMNSADGVAAERRKIQPAGLMESCPPQNLTEVESCVMQGSWTELHDNCMVSTSCVREGMEIYCCLWEANVGAEPSLWG